MSKVSNVFGSRSTFDTGHGEAVIYRLDSLAKAGIADVSRLPVSLRVLLESLLRNFDGRVVTEEQIVALATWTPEKAPAKIPALAFTRLRRLDAEIRAISPEREEVVPIRPPSSMRAPPKAICAPASRQ